MITGGEIGFEKFCSFNKTKQWKKSSAMCHLNTDSVHTCKWPLLSRWTDVWCWTSNVDTDSWYLGRYRNQVPTSRVYNLGEGLENCRYPDLLKLTPAVNIVEASYLDEQKDWPRSKRYPNTTVYLL
jgi:hypothetical protein